MKLCDVLNESKYPGYTEKVITRNIWYTNLMMDSFKNCYLIVDGNLDVNSKEIKSFKDLPCIIDTVTGEFDCSDNELTSLEGGPRICGDVSASDNRIKTFEGCPEIVNGLFHLTNNEIESLKGIHTHLKECKNLTISENIIKEGGIGILLIKNLEWVKYNHVGDDAIKAFDIISKYIPQGKAGLLACQDELEEADLEEFAKL